MPSGGHTVTTPITNPDAHLLCRAIEPSGLTLRRSVTMKNEFGTGALHADRGAVVVPAVVGDDHDAAEVPGGAPRRRTSTRSRATR